MSGFLSFLFLLLVVWALLHCAHAFLRLVGEAFFSTPPDASRAVMRRVRGRAPQPCPNPHCRKDNRGGARFCARCGQPLGTRMTTDRAA